MNSDTNDPKITKFLRQFTFIEAAVLVVAGFGLFLFPQYLRPIWAWEIAPFNARFLGGIYIGAMLPVALMYVSGRWSPSRVVLRAIFTFTLIVLIVSIYHADRFDYSNPSVWVWFALYIGLPASGGYHLWLYRRMPVEHLPVVPGPWRAILRTTGILLAVYGIGLIVQPTVFSALFPWTLDAFHSQLYSATFITGCVIMLSVAGRASKAEFLAAGLTEATFGILSIAGLYIVDAQVKKIDFAATNTLAWLILLGALSALGLAMIIAAQRSEAEL